MSAAAPICVQIAALGGQGGGVLAEWMAEAARHGGYAAQVTSIPGVAQRTGATTYYFELYPERDTAEKPLFCLSPDTDGLDLMIAMEPLEAVRALELGFITQRTTVLTAKNRIYSTAEKSVAGNGAVPTESLFDALEGAAKEVIGVDMDRLSAANSGAPGNAVMFGVIAASGILPMGEEDFLAAIRIKGIAVKSSLEDFSAGFRQRIPPVAAETSGGGFELDPAPAGLGKEIETLPENIRALAGHVCARLIDYQNVGYARLFLKRFQPFAGASPELKLEVARRLGAWMSYEDVIRVAQLKTRPGRLARIRGEVGIDGNAPLTVTEFLKPGREELASLMPPGLGRMIMKGHRPSSTSGLRLWLPSTTFYGYGALKVLAGLRPWRPRTYRFEREQEAIERWLGVVEETMGVDDGLALGTAKLAILARGYGGVRARGLKQLDDIFRHWRSKLKEDLSSLAGDVAGLLHQARHDPDKACGTEN